MQLLVFNAGSSSLKFDVLEPSPTSMRPMGPAGSRGARPRLLTPQLLTPQLFRPQLFRP
jgi:acetate kinase